MPTKLAGRIGKLLAGGVRRRFGNNPASKGLRYPRLGWEELFHRFCDWPRDIRRMGWWNGVVVMACERAWTGKRSQNPRYRGLHKFQSSIFWHVLIFECGYFGHGGAELEYVCSHKIRTLPTCAATVRCGCSAGDFDQTKAPYSQPRQPSLPIYGT